MSDRSRYPGLSPATFHSRLAALMIAASLAAGCVTAQPPPDDDWWGPDKALHYFISAGLAAVVYSAARDEGQSESDAFNQAMYLTVAFGAGKELYDERVQGTFWSWKDFVWDILGALTGGLVASR